MARGKIDLLLRGIFGSWQHLACFLFFFFLPEKAMAPHSSTLAWKFPWMEEPSGPRSMGSLGVGHDWATSLSLFTFMHWRRKWQPTPVFLLGESQGQGSLVGCRLWGSQSRTQLKRLSSSRIFFYYMELQSLQKGLFDQQYRKKIFEYSSSAL